VKYAAAFVEWYAEEAKRAYGEIVPSHAANKRLFAMRQPVGPVYAVTPWNFPAAMVTRKVAPALAAGCTVVLKPAEQSPLTAIRLGELWGQAGGPAGVFQVLTTSDPVAVSEVFFSDARVRKLTFTGSTEVGITLYEKAARTVKRVSLELGGHAPFIVCEDADIPAAVQQVMASKFRNAGQTCVCANRIYVHDRIEPAFTDRLAEGIRNLRVGDPMSDQTQVGPLVDRQGLDKVAAHVDDAIGKGANAVVGGKRRDGLFFDPTLLTGVRSGMRILEEETFGPVAPIVGFTDEAEIIRAANATPYGLAAYVWTKDLGRAFRIAEQLEYGIVGVNDGLPAAPHAPFGGVKFSGIGREGGPWGMDEYLDIRYVSIALP
jgi:succinate-semialdehyde dehydrogenase/glutarate-semialdehyde dehydrogenase